jgi:dienelactone hydrolase
MQRSLLLGFVLFLSFSCAQTAKNKKVEYNPAISFKEENKVFLAKVQLPKTKFEKPLPLVVIVHEWWGRTDYIEMRSQMLNQAGFATLAVDLYGDNKIVETPTQAQTLATPFYQNAQMGIARLNQYITKAKQDPHVDPKQVYVIGYCFGGTQALNLARSGADIKGIVSFHGGLAPGVQAKNIKAKILAINGLADPMVPVKERDAFNKEMKTLKADFKVINYKGATHAFTNPKATEVGKKYKIPVAYNKKADEKSWQELLKFLKQ